MREKALIQFKYTAFSLFIIVRTEKEYERWKKIKIVNGWQA